MTTTAAAVEIVPLESQRAAGAALARAIRERHTFLALTGECDVGKTIVLDAALAVVTDEALRLIMVGNPRAGPLTLSSVLQQIAQYAPPPAGAEEGDVERIHAMLEAGDHKRFVIVVEDAESLHPKALSFLQLLPELSGLAKGSVQIVLVGGPSLWRLLEGEGLGRIREQLTVRITVEPLSDAEARYFAAWRCRERLERFGPEATSGPMIEALVHYGVGRPGRIDALVDRISLLAPSRGGADPTLVAEAAEMLGGPSMMSVDADAPPLVEPEPVAPDVQPAELPPAAGVARRRPGPALVAGLIVVAGVAGWLSYGRLNVPWMPRPTKTGIIADRASATAAPHDAPAGGVAPNPRTAAGDGPNPPATRQASAVGVLPPPPASPPPPPAPRAAPTPPAPSLPETSGTSAPSEPQGGVQPDETNGGPSQPAPSAAAAPVANAPPTPQVAPQPAVTPPRPAAAPAAPAAPAAKPAGPSLASLRKDFDAFLAKAGKDTASLTEAQKRTLFEQYLAWRNQNGGNPPAAGAPASAAH